MITPLRKTVILMVAAAMVASMPSAFADEHEPPEELNETSLAKVALLADFAAGEDAQEADLEAASVSVTELRTSGIGWGALFKIYKFAAAMGEDPAALAADIGADGEFDFGELKNSLTEEQREAFDAMAKNFGTLVASEKKAALQEAKAERKAEREARKAERKAEREARKAERKGGG